MTTDLIAFRVAEDLDCDAVATVFRTSRQFFLPYLPDLHTFEEDRGAQRRARLYILLRHHSADVRLHGGSRRRAR